MRKKTALILLSLPWLYSLFFLFFRQEPDWYSYHMAFNEHWYSSVIRGDITDNVMPPGFIWFGMPLHSIRLSPVIALRLVSLIAFTFLFCVIYKIYGEKKAILLASLPYIALWSSRAQTDMLFCALAFGGLFISMNNKSKQFLAGIVSGISTFVKPPGVLVGLGKWNIRYWLGIIIGMIPFLVWLYFHKESIAFHAGDSKPFGDAIRIVWALIVGLGISWLLIDLKSINWSYKIMIIVYLLFALFKAPIGHEYYLLPVYIASIMLYNTENKKYWFVVGVNSLMSLGLLILLNNWKP